MRRREFLKAAGVAAVSVALQGGKALGQLNNKSGKKTNFVFIFRKLILLMD